MIAFNGQMEEKGFISSNNDGKPREVQLHGYGNERHGVNKEHSHKIPQKVRSFVDRWEKEILMPWWVEQNQQQKEKTA